MKKIILAILFSIIILASSFNVSGRTKLKVQENKQIDSSEVLIKNFMQIAENDANASFRFQTAGPRNLLYFKLKIDNGSIIDRYALYETLVINIVIRAFFLLWTPLKSLRPIIYVISEQGKIDFTLEYKRDIPKGNVSRYKYWTQFGGYENNSFTTNSTSIYNEKHKLEVKGFHGAILTTKRTVITPPLIVMFGTYDKITLHD